MADVWAATQVVVGLSVIAALPTLAMFGVCRLWQALRRS